MIGAVVALSVLASAALTDAACEPACDSRCGACEKVCGFFVDLGPSSCDCEGAVQCAHHPPGHLVHTLDGDRICAQTGDCHNAAGGGLCAAIDTVHCTLKPVCSEPDLAFDELVIVPLSPRECFLVADLPDECPDEFLVNEEDFTLPDNVGLGSLESRSFAGEPLSEFEGLHVYGYRVDLSGMAGFNCVTKLHLEFGAPASFDYDADGVAGEQAWQSPFGPGGIAPSSVERAGNTVVVAFSGGGLCPGQTSRAFGLASSDPPRILPAEVQDSRRCRHEVEALAPLLGFESALRGLREALVTLRAAVIEAPTPSAREGRRRAMLNRVSEAERLAGQGSIADAVAVLENLQSKMDGLGKDWVTDDPSSEQNERALLFEMLQEVIDLLAQGGGP